MTTKANRPWGVSILSILILVTGIGLIVRGVMGMVRGGEGGAGITVAVILVAAGLVYCLVARGIWNGNRAARVVVVIVTAFALVGSIATLAEPGELWPSIVQIIIAVVILVLLFQSRARAFFGRAD